MRTFADIPEGATAKDNRLGRRALLAGFAATAAACQSGEIGELLNQITPTTSTTAPAQPAAVATGDVAQVAASFAEPQWQVQGSTRQVSESLFTERATLSQSRASRSFQTQGELTVASFARDVRRKWEQAEALVAVLSGKLAAYVGGEGASTAATDKAPVDKATAKAEALAAAQQADAALASGRSQLAVYQDVRQLCYERWPAVPMAPLDTELDELRSRIDTVASLVSQLADLPA